MKHDGHSVSYTLSRNHTVVVQYISDENTDMFQVGRSHESSIDFIVLDTVIHRSLNNNEKNSNLNNDSKQPFINNNLNNEERMNSAQSTISRYSFRIVVDRFPPYTARLYAAGFDTSKHIFLGVSSFFFILKLNQRIFKLVLILAKNRKKQPNGEIPKVNLMV
jgi:pellino protein